MADKSEVAKADLMAAMATLYSEVAKTQPTHRRGPGDFENWDVHVFVIGGLHAVAHRLYRGVYELLKAWLDEEALVLCRTLFEDAATLAFLNRNRERLVAAGQFDDAMEMDIDDIRNKFGSKYDSEILLAIDALARMC